MPSIYKRPGVEIYQAQFYVTVPATGEWRKIRKSTGHRNKKKAREFADAAARNAQSVVKAGSDRAQRAKSVLADAVAEIERETFTAPTARKYLSKLLSIATGEATTAYTITSWSEEWLRRKARESSKATVARYNGHPRRQAARTAGYWVTAARRKPLPLRPLPALRRNVLNT